MPQQRRGKTIAFQNTVQPPAPEVAKRLCDLLLSFPSAALSGVQWQVLARRYEERHNSRLDLAALGHSSPLGAASALLWEVLRVVDKDDSDNPVLGIEDGVALTAEPGCMACWPSLYGVLCTIAQEHGARDESDPSKHSLLLSQLRPLLESQWHAGFDETALGYRGEDGAFVRFKKMKHLLHAVLRWREQRQAWQQSRGLRLSAVDEVLIPTLELVPSKKHNDLLLRWQAPGRALATQPVLPLPCRIPEAEDSSDATPTAHSIADQDLQSEVERLRAENEGLRAVNLQLQGGQVQVLHASIGDIDACPTPDLLEDVFDDPFEPPLGSTSWIMQKSPSLSCKSSTTDTDSEFHYGMWGIASSSSGWHSERTSLCGSGAMTPVQHAGNMTPVQHAFVPQQSCAMLSAWFPFVPTTTNGVIDVSVIPRGIVQSAREQFERIVG